MESAISSNEFTPDDLSHHDIDGIGEPTAKLFRSEIGGFDQRPALPFRAAERPDAQRKELANRSPTIDRVEAPLSDSSLDGTSYFVVNKVRS